MSDNRGEASRGWGGGMAMMELAASKRVQRSNSRLLAFKLGGTGRWCAAR